MKIKKSKKGQKQHRTSQEDFINAVTEIMAIEKNYYIPYREMSELIAEKVGGKASTHLARLYATRLDPHDYLPERLKR